mmetsp:Transcript_21839/g.40741  ORF Transcript_21839/g.40741 Transcript_21839/m.40741 type:complete len:87 (-) Transcript_21839:351-611(-)
MISRQPDIFYLHARKKTSPHSNFCLNHPYNLNNTISLYSNMRGMTLKVETQLSATKVQKRQKQVDKRHRAELFLKKVQLTLLRGPS